MEGVSSKGDRIVSVHASPSVSSGTAIGGERMSSVGTSAAREGGM